MYMKVYYDVKKRRGQEIAHADDVRAALPADMPGLTVDEPFGYPCVNFPDGAKYNPDFVRIQHILKDAGFETE